jgi:hypothetical protein
MNFTLKKSDLNFKVYTVPSKPTTPGAENDIAIISSVPMTNWIMSPEAPSGIPRTDGDVWIQYSVAGDTFNALKQNALMIATIKAWQYVDGAWVDREAVSCQGGAWVDWITKISFAKSNWKSFNPYPADRYVDYAAGYAYSDTKFTATILGEWDMVAIASSVTYDLTNVDNIKFKATLSKSLNDNAVAFVAVSKTQVLYDSSETLKADAIQKFITKVTSKETPISVKGLSGKYYILVGIYAWYDNGSTTFTVENMTLE